MKLFKYKIQKCALVGNCVSQIYWSCGDIVCIVP